MGILGRFRRTDSQRGNAVTKGAPLLPSDWTIGAPPVPGAGQARISEWLWRDAYVDRLMMMRIPAVKRGRGVICNTVGGFPFRAWRTSADGAVSSIPVPAVLRQPEAWTNRTQTMLWTVDDLIFYGHSWWLTTERNSFGWPTRFERILPTRVTYQEADATGQPIQPQVYIDGVRYTGRDLVRFDGPDEGLVRLGGPSISSAYALENAAQFYADTNIPLIILKYLGEGILTREQAVQIREDWEESRRASNVGVVGANMGVDIPQPSAVDNQLIEQRQYSALEVSRLLGIRPRYVNAPSGDTSTYANLSQEREDLANDLRPFIQSIEQRLSMDDITPRGTSIRMDMDGFLNPNPLERAQYWAQLVTAGIATPEQAMEAEGLSSTDAVPGDDRR